MGEFERFAEYYDLVYRRMVDYEKECDLLERIFRESSRGIVKTVLDVGCGTGSHALILSNRGYDVTGIDVSKTMIEKAKRKAERAKVDAEFFVQDMRTLDLNRTFDCAICMFGGFGYIHTAEDLASLFSGLRHHLVEDGLLIFEFWSVGGLKPSPYQSWIEVQNGDLSLYRLSESNFDPQTNVLDIAMHFIVIRDSSVVERFSETHRIRCYTLPEMRQYLDDSGFELLSAYDWDSKDPSGLQMPRKETFRILAVSEKKSLTHEE